MTTTMKKALFSALVLVAALASCSKKQDTTPVLPTEDVKMVPVTFTAGVETKTKLDGDGHSIVWQKTDTHTDKITVFANGNNYEFSVASGHGSSSATFTGMMSEADAAASEFYALYPADATATISGNSITAKGISNNVNNVTNNVPNDYVQSVAHTTDGNFNFKIVCAMVKLSVPASMGGLLKNIMVSTNGGPNKEPFVGGTAEITVSDNPTVKLTSGLADVQTSKNAGIAAGTYYFPVYPIALASGIRVKLTYVSPADYRYGGEKNAEYLFTGKALTLERARIMNLGELHEQGTYMFSDFENYSERPSWVKNTEPTFVTFEGTKCLKRTGKNASGYTQFNFDYTEAKEKFPTAARDKFRALRLKVYVPEGDEFYPILQINGDAKRSAPDVVNGVSVTNYSNGIQKGAWNTLEFHFPVCTIFAISNAAGINYMQVRPFCDQSGNQLNDNVNHTCYIDDVEFLYN